MTIYTLYFTLSKDAPFFIPIRCGLNALLCDKSKFRSYKNYYSYSAIYEYWKNKCAHKQNSDLAIFDNSGSFMPILISIYYASQKDIDLPENIYNTPSKVLLDISNWLKMEQDRLKNDYIFVMYSDIEDLAHSLTTHRTIIVFGGGSWICDPKCTTNKVFIPKKEDGYLWVEGAVINKNANAGDKCMDFIATNMLSKNFQDNIIKENAVNIMKKSKSDPSHYNSFPVITKSIRSLLAEQKSQETEMQRKILANTDNPYLEETALLFKSSNQFNGNIKIRQSPRHIKEWMTLWEQVKNLHSEQR